MKGTNKRSMIRSAVVLGVILLVGGTAWAQKATYNAMPGIDFSKFKTYKWVKIEGSMHPDQIVETQIMQAIDAQLAGKGFTKVDGDSADLYVGYQISVSQEKELNAYSTGGYGWRWGGGMATATTSTISVGTLALDVYDPAAKQLVWRGAVTKTLDPGAKPEKRQKNLNKAVGKLMKNFPPPAKK